VVVRPTPEEIGAGDQSAAVRTTRYNDTGVLPHDKISAKGTF